MKKAIANILIILVVVSSSLLLSACFQSTTVDGIKLSRVSYTSKLTRVNEWGNNEYEMVFSCQVENTTKDAKEFEVVYIGRFGGVLTNPVEHTEVVVLQAKEKKKLSYKKENAGDQVYTKKIEIRNVSTYSA